MRRLIALPVAAALSAGAAAQSTQPATATDPPSPPLDKVAYVLMETSMGDIVIELDHQRAPITVENFARYVDEEFYDGTIFHRVIDNFMIQGGGFTPDMTEKQTHADIKNEWRNGLKNKRGTIAMARRGGAPDSASSQFFINVVDNFRLDQPQRDGAAYAVFGQVVVGMDVVDRIRKVDTGIKKRHENVPIEPVVIKKARRINPDEAAKLIGEKPTSRPAE